MVLLDSNHAKQHVSNELEHYSRFVSHGSYIVVFDTVVEDFLSDTSRIDHGVDQTVL